MEITGEFVLGDEVLNDASGFEIHEITHNNMPIEFDGLTEDVLMSIQVAALDHDA
jgi:hypothetical protein